MDEGLEEKFREIAEKAIEDAEAVDCSIEEFIEGLRTMAAALNDRADQG